jgi:hypothetical protein
MAKSQDAKKTEKKEPLKTAKEKQSKKGLIIEIEKPSFIAKRGFFVF